MARTSRAPSLRVGDVNSTEFDLVDCIIESDAPDEATVVEICREEARDALSVDPDDPVLQEFDSCMLDAGDNATQIVECYVNAVKGEQLKRQEEDEELTREFNFREGIKKMMRRMKGSRESVASLGAAGGLTYWNFKMLKHSIITFLSWYLISVRTGISPRLQWPKFLAYYTSLYVSIAFLQPMKFAAIALLTPTVDRKLKQLAEKFGLDRKLAFAAAFAISTVSGGAFYCSSVVMASALSHVPF
jgi:hypothetical protein